MSYGCVCPWPADVERVEEALSVGLALVLLGGWSMCSRRRYADRVTTGARAPEPLYTNGRGFLLGTREGATHARPRGVPERYLDIAKAPLKSG
jgi:hypothetical protein